MAKYQTPKSSKSGPSYGRGNKVAEYGTFKDRNLAAMSPEKAQEALKPTDAEPVRMQHRMAGCS